MSIYIGNLPYDATQDSLSTVFAEYGTVGQIYLPVGRETSKQRGFGFIEMLTDAEEEAAISDLDGAESMGRWLRVNKARPRTENSDSRSNKEGWKTSNSFSNRY
jgi:RNA recognition motif-containing protein